MKKFTDNLKKASIYSTKIFLFFLRFSVLFLLFGLIYYINILKQDGQFIFFQSIYAFIESAFYLLAIGAGAATFLEWMIRKNK